MKSNITPITDHVMGSNYDGDIKSLVHRLLAVEDRIDHENKLKALIFAEAKVNNVDIGALKATIRTIRYMPQSGAENLFGLSETVKSYLDIVVPKRGSEKR
ncbi:hypothetical protein J1C56_01855 [Aminobacter anthyllidis]|uniref:Uncharacterized protein n=1 Tax=Aminobacter anthyllidis TaxID=1035067 RepID=A0A9X1A6U6_9HYPH|nr:hypothetical protein [Aminobacter anthyllidis]MBT1154329.1 hypothetical protein [Aminobacter anthyllidis]